MAGVVFVMSYEQHMKHWRNHSKDRFTQQCSGPTRNTEVESHSCPVALSRNSFQRLMDSLKCDDFPVYVKQGSGGIWSFTNERDSFGTKINDMTEMRKFYEDCVW